MHDTSPDNDVSVHLLQLSEAVFADRTKRNGQEVRAPFNSPDIIGQSTRVLKEVALMQEVIELGRKIREKHKISWQAVKQTLMVIHDSQDKLDLLSTLSNYIQDEITVKNISKVTDNSVLT